MATTLSKKLKKLSSQKRKKIDARAQELFAEEKTLSDLRKALHLTQEEVGKKLHIKQDGISRLERRTDLLLSTLRNYIQSMGGELILFAEFPDRPPVKLTGISDLENHDEKRSKALQP